MGTHYHGWQRQPSVLSVQQVIEDCLSNILGAHTIIVGCGRTDTGVHASKYYFHTDITHFPDYNLIWRLNKRLPDDITIWSIVPISDVAHARFDAVQRKYIYKFHTQKDPFLSNLSAYYEGLKLDLELMRNALGLIAQHHDFKKFCRTPERHNTTLCTINMTKIELISPHNYIIEIVANRFLRSMIRIIVERIIRLGSGRLSLAQFESYFEDRISSEQVVLAPAQGLYLKDIVYPYATL